LLGITALSQSPIASLGGTNVNVAVTGVELTSSLNSVITQADANAFPNSQLLTTTVDPVVVELNTPVQVLGQELNVNLGNETIQIDVKCRSCWRRVKSYPWNVCYCNRWKYNYYCWS
jgi:hypothetical protein